jgi:GT2 family glycosyltransferase
MMDQTPEISVIVCSYDGATKIGGCLTSLEAQSARGRFEVIVVDDGSMDATAQVAGQYDVKLIRHRVNRGLSAARNTGLEAASAPIVAFLDDDCIAPPQWVELLLDSWASAPDDVVGIGGVVLAATTDTLNRRFMEFRNPLAPVPLGLDASTTFASRVRIYLTQRGHVAIGEGSQRVSSLVGANMSFRASALAEVGGFDESRTFGGDESYVCVRLRESFGAQSLLCDTTIVMSHDFAPDFRDTLRRGFAYGKGLGRNQVTDGGLPSIQPLGLLAMVALVTSIFVVPLLLLATLLIVPAALQRRAIWPLHKENRLERLAYPWLVVAEEIAVNCGIAVGWSKTKFTR